MDSAPVPASELEPAWELESAKLPVESHCLMVISAAN
jgi:hypothetical protein